MTGKRNAPVNGIRVCSPAAVGIVFLMASGKALMAWRSQEWLLSYIGRMSPVTGVTDSPDAVEGLLAELAAVRERGYALSENVADSGVGAIGARAFARLGEVVLTVGISAPLSRFHSEQRDRHLELLLQTTERLSARLQLCCSAEEGDTEDGQS